jgi:hypothetical protein
MDAGRCYERMSPDRGARYYYILICLVIIQEREIFTEIYAKHIKESAAQFVAVDPDTISVVSSAMHLIDHEIQLISVGEETLPATLHISQLLEDDGSGQSVIRWFYFLKHLNVYFSIC